ncbi:hypothetical protein KI387_028155, partial [Taxus chinensis]
MGDFCGRGVAGGGLGVTIFLAGSEGFILGLGYTFLGKGSGGLCKVEGDVKDKDILESQGESGGIRNRGVMGNGEYVGRRGDEDEGVGKTE